MIYHIRPIFIFVLLNLYCYSLSLPCIDQNTKDQLSSLNDFNPQDVVKPSMNNRNDPDTYVNILCAIYDDCSGQHQHNHINSHMKPKRLMSNLFHGIPKFGKRALSSAFYGIPKFG